MTLTALLDLTLSQESLTDAPGCCMKPSKRHAPSPAAGRWWTGPGL